MTKLESSKYRKTKRGLISQMLSSQKARSKERGDPKPAYTYDELRDWLYGQHLFHDLYDLWVMSGFDKWQAPSIDRDDDYDSYRFGNITLMTWRENHEKGVADRSSGKNSKLNKRVAQISLDGHIIKIHDSVQAAARNTDADAGNISNCCNGKQGKSKGCRWEFI